MTLPNATLVEVPPAGQIAANAPADVAVFFGCSSKGPLGVPTPFGPQNTAGAEATFGCGPLSRETCYPMAKVPKQFVMIRLPATSVAAQISTPVITANASSTFTAVASGTPTDGVDVIIAFPTGGTTGTAGIMYTLSLDGGVTVGAATALGTATSITVNGVSIALGSGRTITAGDEIAFWTQAASATILPTTVTRVASSTSTYTFSGTPNDGYEMVITWVTGGTVGTIGPAFTYSLDGGLTTSAVVALPLSGAFALPDHNDSTGVTLTCGAGTISAGDTVAARTTPPAYQWSDAQTALNTLRSWSGIWSFVVFTGYGTRAFRDNVESQLQSYATSGRFTWGACPGRDRITGETTASPNNVSGDLAWSGRIVSEWTGSAGNRTPPIFGSIRCTDPQTGRRNRRPITVALISRIIGITPDTDPGDRTLPNDGALSSDVSIHSDITGALAEHDARANTSLFDLGGNVLRTWYGEEGLEPGVYPAGGRLMSASGDIQRWQQRRVQNLADAASFTAMAKLVLMKFGVWPASVKPPYNPGDIMAWDLNNMQQQLFAAVYAAVAPYVSAPRSGGIQVVITPTPGLVAGNTVVYQTTKLVGKQYLDTFSGTLGFVNPSLASLFSAPAS